MADQLTPKQQKPQKKPEGRSPAYPFIPVYKAIERVQELYNQEGAHAAPLKSALAAWGYGPKSSGGRQTLATMKYYGLIDVTGEGDGRMIRVSEIARKIILDKREDGAEKRALIRQVALMPTAHKTLYQEYPSGLPSDGTVHHFLVFRKQFNNEAANELLAEFKQTASHIGLYEPQTVVDKSQEEPDSEDADEDRLPIRVGDRIQWLSNGIEQFPGGALVEAIHPGGEWLWVSEKLTKSGISMGEVQLLERGLGDVAAAPARPSARGGAPNEERERWPEVGKKPKVSLDDDVLTIIASVKMEDLGALKKKIEALEAFYNAG